MLRFFLCLIVGLSVIVSFAFATSFQRKSVSSVYQCREAGIIKNACKTPSDFLDLDSVNDHNTMDADSFFRQLWQDYVNMTPQAEAIVSALKSRGENVHHDHVAFRTLNIGPIRLEVLERFLFDMGYTRYEPYHFSDKKLDAFGYLPPRNDLPRIFLSELRVEELSDGAQRILRRLASSVDPLDVQDASIFWRGPLWNMPTWEEYQLLAEESEYAAWVSVIGLRCNHFAANVNQMQHLSSIEDLNTLVEELGFQVNKSGGSVKGSPNVLLEQGSTLASTMPMAFQGGDVHDVTTCYFEYAMRYKDAEGNLYQGFVAASADKIFESTDMRST